MSLQSAIYEIQAKMREVSGVKNAPNEPPESTDNFPFVATFPGTGEITAVAHGDKKGLHNVYIEFHVTRKDLPIDMRKAVPYVDLIPDKLLESRQDGSFTEFDTFGVISYEFTPMAWGAVETLGYRFTINDLKIREIIS